jgi:hypothetical protein
MSRSGPKYWEITFFDSHNPKHRLVFSLLWYSLVVVLFGLAISRVVMHPPLDAYKLFAYTAYFGVILFVSILGSTGLWSKPLVQRSPLWLILSIFLWGSLLYPVVTHFPIDYFALFGYLASFAFVLMLQIKALARERNTPT